MLKNIGITKKQMIWLLLAVPFNFSVYYGGRLLAENLPHYNLSTPWDLKIPVLPWMVLIYWGCYLFWVVNYYLGVRFDKGGGYRFLLSHFMGEFTCFLFFAFLPTSMSRPEILGNSVFDYLLSLTYLSDAPNNLFPSIHCFAGWLCWIGVRNNLRIPKWYQIFSLASAIAICISTLTIKQHVIADVISGILLTELSYWVAGKLEKYIVKE